LAVEEHSIVGGFGGAVAEALAKHAPAKMDFIGVEDRFTESGPYDALLKKYGISVEAIVAKAKALVAAKPAARKPAPAAAPARKAAAKTVVKRKAVAKKSVAKKAVATKPAAKKIAAKKVVRKKVVAKRPVRKAR
jgi:topoisomerase IA-like protein